VPPIVETLNTTSQVWAGLMWAVVWQSTLLALAVALIALLLRQSSPGVRYWLWQIVAVKLLLMPFWTLAVPLPSFGFAAATDRTAEVSAATSTVAPGVDERLPVVDVDSPPASLDANTTSPPNATARYSQVVWQSWLLSAWLAVVAVQLIRLTRQRLQLGRLLKQASPAETALVDLMKTTADQLSLKRLPSVLLTETECSPFVCGLRRPTIVLPRSLTESFDESRKRQVLLHELAHIKRLDLLWGWIPELMRMVYFFHPVAHWVNDRIRLERELACDQLAMAFGGQDAADYARTLVEVVSHAAEPSVLKASAASAGLVEADAAVKAKQQNH
jgi:beta-lactamase regulating signal transducer with metallopeptidase domain